MKSIDKMPTLQEQINNINKSKKIRISLIDCIVFLLIFLLGVAIGASL